MKAVPRLIFLCSLLLWHFSTLRSQRVGINEDSSPPNTRAILDVKSTTMGVLVPRMNTAQFTTFESTLGNSEEGMLVFHTDLNSYFYWTGSEFRPMGSGTVIIDHDGDTKVDVEESPDEDMIRFDIGGDERWVMDGAKLEAINPGNSVFIGEGAGENDDLSTNRNTFIGYQAGLTNTNGFNNVAIGYRSLLANNSGGLNTAMGHLSLNSNTTGNYNTSIGAFTLTAQETSSYNTAIGYGAIENNTTGIRNTGLGPFALTGNISGDNNTAIGYGANVGTYNLTNATAIGYNAIVNTSNSLILGNDANIGVGTSSPINRMDIHLDGIADTTATVLALVSNISNRPVLLFSEWEQADPGSGMSIEYDGTGMGSGNRLHIRGVDMTRKFTVESTGDVGVGVENPNEILEVGGDGRFFVGDGGGAQRRGLLIDAVEAGDYVRLDGYDYGTAESMDIFIASNVNIGSSTGATGYMLSVDGKIMAEEVRVQLSGAWPDYVFSESYPLLSLRNLEMEIQRLGRLPGIPAATEVQTDGIELGEMQRMLLEKIEELTLHIIDLNKRIERLEQ